jgi:hypothetical protein
MSNINKFNGGFVMNDLEYFFDGEPEIINNTQAHIPTDRGIIFIDLSITINNLRFDGMSYLLEFLYKI